MSKKRKEEEYTPTRPCAEAAARTAALNQAAAGGTESEKPKGNDLPGTHSEVDRPDTRRTHARQNAGNRFQTVRS